MFFHSKEFIFVALCVISRCLGDEEDNTSGGGGGGGGGGGSQSSSGGGGGGGSSSGGGGGAVSTGAGWVTIGGGGGGSGVTIGTGVGAGGQSFMTVGSGGSAPSVFSLGGGGTGGFVSGAAGGGAFSSGVSMSSAVSGSGQCPWWAPHVMCLQPPCFSNPTCPAFRGARCINNSCGRCSSRFFIGPFEVTRFCNIPQVGQCPPWRPQVYCFVDPCTYSTCPTVPMARCRADYCGGCHARFYFNGYEVTSLCRKHVYPGTQAVSFHQAAKPIIANPIIAKPIHNTHVTHSHHHYKHHLLHHVHHKNVNHVHHKKVHHVHHKKHHVF